MARSKTYRNGNFRGRRIFLVVSFLAVTSLAVWRGIVTNKSNSTDRNPSGSQVAQAHELSAQTVLDRSETSRNSPVEAGPTTPPELNPPDPQPEPVRPEPDRLKPPVNPPVSPSPRDSKSGRALMEEARTAWVDKDYLKAQVKLSQALRRGLPQDHLKEALRMVNQAADQWLFSSHLDSRDSFCERYRIASGDKLVNLGKKNQVPYRLLMRINGIRNPNTLSAGRVIKVVRGPFHVVVDRRQFLMFVYLGDMMIRVYPISTGKPGHETPTGRWVVQVGKKQINPAWRDPDTQKYYYPDDPDNPLGERWIGLKGLVGAAKGKQGFGIHGTIQPEKIGTAASRGCIRLINRDVEELYDLLIEGKSQVLVVN